jgi:hypothetical protein
MKYKIIILITLLSILITSCEDINSNTKNNSRISIISTINTGGEKQYLKVFYVSDISDNGKYDSLAVKDAEVKISGDNFVESLKYSEAKNNEGIVYDYFYETVNSIKDKLLPGKTYRLYVKSDHNVINGTTTFPDDFHIISHKNNDTIDPTENITLRWSKSNNSYFYVILYGSPMKMMFNGGIVNEFTYYNTILTKDTLFELPKYAGPMPIESEYRIIKVIAMDKNYYDHTYLMRDRAGLDGGYGCFSSGVVDTVRLYYKK